MSHRSLLAKMWAVAWEKEDQVSREHEYEIEQMRLAIDTVIGISERLLQEKTALQEENEKLRKELDEALARRHPSGTARVDVGTDERASDGTAAQPPRSGNQP